MLVSIRRLGSSEHSCSGTILDAWHVLTSAQCVERESPTSPRALNVVAGIHNQSDERAISRRVDRIYFHPQWSNENSQNPNQLAILHVAEKFNFAETSTIVPTCLAPGRDDEYPTNGTELVVIGWGTAQTIHQAKVFAIHYNDRRCTGVTNEPEKQFCAGRDQGGAGQSR